MKSSEWRKTSKKGTCQNNHRVSIVKIMKLKNSIVVILFLTVFSCCAAKSKGMKAVNLWYLVDNIKVTLPEGFTQLAYLFDSPFIFQNENDVFTTYKNKNFMLEGNISVEDIEARIFRKNNDAIPYLLTFKISGACVNLAELKNHYADLMMADVPRGRSLAEETVYSTYTDDNHIKLAFGFAEKKPECLRSVVFSVG